MNCKFGVYLKPASSSYSQGGGLKTPIVGLGSKGAGALSSIKLLKTQYLYAPSTNRENNRTLEIVSAILSRDFFTDNIHPEGLLGTWDQDFQDSKVWPIKHHGWSYSNRAKTPRMFCLICVPFGHYDELEILIKYHIFTRTKITPKR